MQPSSSYNESFCTGFCPKHISSHFPFTLGALEAEYSLAAEGVSKILKISNVVSPLGDEDLMELTEMKEPPMHHPDWLGVQSQSPTTTASLEEKCHTPLPTGKWRWRYADQFFRTNVLVELPTIKAAVRTLELIQSTKCSFHGEVLEVKFVKSFFDFDADHNNNDDDGKAASSSSSFLKSRNWMVVDGSKLEKFKSSGNSFHTAGLGVKAHPTLVYKMSSSSGGFTSKMEDQTLLSIAEKEWDSCL